MTKILLVVEGEADVLAAPLLVRRVLHEVIKQFGWEVFTQRRKDIEHLRSRDWYNFNRYLKAAYNEGAPILWMLDADDGCPVDLARQFYSMAAATPVRQPLAFAFWHREYETMFLHSPSAIQSKYALDKCPAPPVPPEKCRGAKEWISKQLPAGLTYKERVDQPALSSVVDLSLLRANYKSYAHFERCILWLTSQLSPAVYPTP